MNEIWKRNSHDNKTAIEEWRFLVLMVAMPQKNFLVINKTMYIAQDWILITVLIANQVLWFGVYGFMGTVEDYISVLKTLFVFCSLKLENSVLKWK